VGGENSPRVPSNITKSASFPLPIDPTLSSIPNILAGFLRLDIYFREFNFDFFIYS
jgi:hypothetical protein